MDSGTWRLGHRPALDGLRGVAILLVLLGHCLVPVVDPGAGKVGVSVFFVLSGFLITSLLLEERADTGRVSLRRFYVRRLRRLAPAQVLVVAIVGAFGLSLGVSRWLSVGDVFASAFYVKNLTAADDMLAHFWSLAVEEQFYLTWAPLLAGLLVRGIRDGWLVAGLLVAASASFTVRMAGVDSQALPFQADPILVGCALAVWLHGRPAVCLGVGWVLASGVVLFALCQLPDATQYTVGLGAAAVPTVGLVLASVSGPGPALLCHPVMRWLGLRSYSLYLWHWPIRYVLRDMLGVDSWPMLALLVIVPSCLLAEASYRFVELPFRAVRSVPGRAQVVAAS